MKRLSLGSLLVLVLSLGGCMVVPVGPRRVYAAPVVVAPAPVVAVRVWGVYRYR